MPLDIYQELEMSNDRTLGKLELNKDTNNTGKGSWVLCCGKA